LDGKTPRTGIFLDNYGGDNNPAFLFLDEGGEEKERNGKKQEGQEGSVVAN